MSIGNLRNLEKITSITIDNASHVHQFSGEFTPLRRMPIHMDDNPVTIEALHRESIKGGGLFNGFKEDFDVHFIFPKKFVVCYASIIIYIGTFVNDSLA